MVASEKTRYIPPFNTNNETLVLSPDALYDQFIVNIIQLIDLVGVLKMQEYEIALFREHLNGEPETFSQIYTSKLAFKRMGDENVFKWVSRALNSDKSLNERINACYALQKMGENKQHKRKRRECKKKLLRILETGDNEEKEACLNALLYFDRTFEASKVITKHILPERDISHKGFEVIREYEGDEVAKLLKIAYQHDNLVSNWMR